MTLKCDFDHSDKMFKCLILLLSHAFLIILHVFYSFLLSVMQLQNETVSV